MSADGMRIALTAEEQVVLGQIELDASAQHDYQRWRQNGEFVVTLINSLIDRNGIPAHRVRYFDDPIYNPGGRGKSRMDVFEGNGCRGEDIFRHNHFLKFLRYFLHGPILPAAIIAQFQQAVDACGMVTSGDVIPLSKQARDLVRAHRLDPDSASDEVFKLALETGLDPSDAEVMRRSVRQIQRR